MDLTAIRQRYLQEHFPKRLAALAANLARISSFSKRGQNIDLIKNLIRESEYFIEWTASEAPFNLQVKLVDLQIRLARWLWRLEQGGNGFDQLAEEFETSSEEMLAAV